MDYYKKHRMLEESCRLGHLEVLKYLLNTYNKEIPVVNYLKLVANINKHNDIVNYLTERYNE